MDGILSLFISTIYAAESFLNPMTAQERLEALRAKQQVRTQQTTQRFGDLAAMGNPTGAGQVLGEQTEDDPPIVLEPTFITEPEPTPKKKKPPVVQTRKANKSAVTIALLGDSMMDTLGPDAPALKSILSRTFPGTAFTIKNYGVGGTNIEYGIQRITNAYSYLGNGIPSLSSIQPDIVVIESFGYNPFSFDEGAIDKHWLSLSTAVDTIRKNVPGAKIIIGSTIAPNWDVFGDGAPGLSFAAEDKRRRVAVIKQYLENAVKFAQSQHLPLADAYHSSMDGSGNGKLAYINPGDHIHYSDAGRALFSQKIASAIISNKLLE